MSCTGSICRSRASGIATLIVDRDYRRVLARADHALVLQKGLVVRQGTADEVATCAKCSLSDLVATSVK